VLTLISGKIANPTTVNIPSALPRLKRKIGYDIEATCDGEKRNEKHDRIAVDKAM